MADAGEGWYVDPFGQHRERWFSEGRPTALVRDAGVEGRDEPPTTDVSRLPLIRSEVEAETDVVVVPGFLSRLADGFFDLVWWLPWP